MTLKEASRLIDKINDSTSKGAKATENQESMIDKIIGNRSKQG